MQKKFLIKSIHAMEILDSRGIPTLQTTVELSGGTSATASVPGGTSAGKYEAAELRDGDAKRYGGKGVLKAVANVNEYIAKKLVGKPIENLKALDSLMLNLDGTRDKSALGANAILSVSVACARAGALAAKMSLYEYLRKSYRFLVSSYELPQPMFNLLNGGAHAESGMDVQEFMLVPAATTFAESLRWAAETFSHLKKILAKNGFATGVGLEGGYAPKLHGSRAALDMLLEAARAAGLPTGKTGIGLDVAASELYQPASARYVFAREHLTFSRTQLVGWYRQLAEKYPIISIEDGFGEDDWAGWHELYQALGKTVQIVGDDLTVTSRARLAEAIKHEAVSALIVKPNQIGTVSETMETIKSAQSNGIKLVVSHRSGDTPDPFIADLAVSVNADFIKSGATSRGERVAKYNRLLEIERELNQ